MNEQSNDEIQDEHVELNMPKCFKCGGREIVAGKIKSSRDSD